MIAVLALSLLGVAAICSAIIRRIDRQIEQLDAMMRSLDEQMEELRKLEEGLSR